MAFIKHINIQKESHAGKTSLSINMNVYLQCVQKLELQQSLNSFLSLLSTRSSPHARPNEF
jgi:hypothetical protein